MNSRDAAYEEAVKAALEASRLEMSGNDEEEGMEEPSIDDEHRTVEKKHKGKRKRDDEESGT